MKYSFILVLLIAIFSCAGPSSQSYQDAGSNVVDLDGNTKLKNAPTIDSEDEISVVGVGPKGGNSKAIDSVSTSSVWALNLSPGLNRVICHAVAVRSLYEKGLKFNMISGSGMASIVAAYLSQETTPEIIEWKFHKFFQKSEGMKPFSQDWLNRVKEDLLKDFKGKKIQNSKITLLIPVYNKMERKVELLRRGDLYEKLLENLRLSTKKAQKEKSVLTYRHVSSMDLKKVGAQKIVEVNVLGKKVSFEGNADFLLGIYGRLVSSRNPVKNETSDNYLLELPIENFSLDSTKDLPEYLRTSYLFVRDNSNEIKESFQIRNKN